MRSRHFVITDWYWPSDWMLCACIGWKRSQHSAAGLCGVSPQTSWPCVRSVALDTIRQRHHGGIYAAWHRTLFCTLNADWLIHMNAASDNLDWINSKRNKMQERECIKTINWLKMLIINMNKKAQLSLTNPHDAKSLPKIAPIRRAYNVVADNTGLSSFV